MIRASIAPEEIEENPWARASWWALQVADYLCKQEGVPAGRVIAVARVVPHEAEDDAGNAVSNRSSLGVVIVPAGAKENESDGERPSVLKKRPVLIQRGVEDWEE